MRSINKTVRDLLGGSKPRTAAAFHVLLCSALLFLSGCAGVRDSSRSFRTVIIDAGHGGHDNGTRSYRPMAEKVAALDVALRLEPKVRAAGFKTVMTRKGDYFVGLDDRVAISNRHGSAVFVSIHFNEARRRRDIYGAEIYYHSPQSVDLANVMLRRVGSIPGSRQRFVKQARFRVLRNNQNPAILIEGGYFSNRAEAGRLASPAYRERLATEIARALKEHHR
jgi:N-acetylmuramoyl-L-alanine amidase